MNDKTKTTIQFLVTIGGVVVAALNIYLAYRIAPLSESVSGHSIRIQAIESNYARNSEMITGFTHIKNEFDRMDKRFDTIENKIDRLR